MSDPIPTVAATVDEKLPDPEVATPVDYSPKDGAIPGNVDDGATGQAAVAALGEEAAAGSAARENGATDLTEQLRPMAAALERFHTRAEQYESIIRRMQTRIEELQSDQVRELLKPIILKLADLHTEASAAEERASASEDDSARKDFDFFVTEIEDTLGLLDIESIGTRVLDEFDPARHAARRRIDSDDPTLDKRIAKVVRQGFTYVGAERVFVPATVFVYRYQPPAEARPIAEAPPITSPTGSQPATASPDPIV